MSTSAPPPTPPGAPPPSEPDPGRQARLDRLVVELMDELRRIAHRILRENQRVDDLHTTVLVHDMYLRLSASQGSSWSTRGEFLTQAATTLRRILTSAARARHAARRGGGSVMEELDVVLDQYEGRGSDGQARTDLIDLDAALERLAAEEPAAARMVEMHYFLCLGTEEIAEALDLTQRRVQSVLDEARTCLRGYMDSGSGDGGETSAV